MSTQHTTTSTTHPAPPPASVAKTDPTGTQAPQITLPPDQLIRCPLCHELIHAVELVAYQPQDLPRVLYKPLPSTPPEEPPPFETKLVADADAEKKAEGEGWQKDPPKPEPKKDKGSDGVKAQNAKDGGKDMPSPSAQPSSAKK